MSKKRNKKQITYKQNTKKFTKEKDKYIQGEQYSLKKGAERFAREKEEQEEAELSTKVLGSNIPDWCNSWDKETDG